MNHNSKHIAHDRRRSRLRRRTRPSPLIALGLAAVFGISACTSDNSASPTTPSASVAPAGSVASTTPATAPAATTPETTPTTTAAPAAPATGDVADVYGAQLIAEGRNTFRTDTFGSEGFFGDVLHLQDAISGSAHGGFGDGVSPATALAVGLKVDVDALPQSLQTDLAAGKVDLQDPATTLALLQIKAVVGVDGQFSSDGVLTSVGITCALCHSTVDNSFAPGVGHRLDGWANRDLNVGAILNLAPDTGLQPVADILHADVPTVRTVLQSWGPGKFDASLFVDGKAFRPDGGSAAVLIPPAYGLAGVNLATWTGWGSVTHWNAFVSNLEMHGSGTFYDPRLNDPAKYPIAVEQHSFDVRPDSPADDKITAKLAALHVYQLAIPAPDAPADSFDAAAAARGEVIFAGQASCATCHVPPLFTEPGFNAHTPEEMGIDSFQADRSPTGMYRTSPLAGLFAHETGGFYHDGRFKTLRDVVDHYDEFKHLGLTNDQKNDLVEYLKSL